MNLHQFNQDSSRLEKSQPVKDTTYQYMEDMAKFSILSPEEERALFDRLVDGDEGAREEIIKANLRLVIKIAKPYYSLGMSKLDIIQEGNIGLIKATHRFNTSLGYRFATYATHCIKKAIEGALAEQGYMVRIPVNSLYKTMKIYQTKTKLEQQYGREVTLEELSEITNIPKDKIDKLLRAARWPLSYNAPLNDRNKLYCIDSLISDVDTCYKSIYQDSLRDILEVMLSVLSEKEANIIRLRNGYYGYCWTLGEISSLYDVTRERIRQIEAEAMKKLRREQYLEQLRCYLEE